jgi:hypothetical protein
MMFDLYNADSLQSKFFYQFGLWCNDYTAKLALTIFCRLIDELRLVHHGFCKFVEPGGSMSSQGAILTGTFQLSLKEDFPNGSTNTA